MTNLHLPFVSRILIALLFVVAGLQKIGFTLSDPWWNPNGFGATVGTMGSLGLPVPALVAALVILIEVPVALLYAWGYRVRYTGGILAVFAFLTILVAHRDFSNSLNMIMALKNLAIIGGILATTGSCSCDRCSVFNPKA